ncbi:DUF4430 domain-containing protein [Allorhodopirellula solitaria]|uniref:Transcobalamin-like C-terminal domain-containing protein n=1 Tax=Allorhodopirellula solitaria TaxID=2527987 RepID=A0A5C5YGR6_9BACT|nr:DUF4430 domain-containing protein [Allorhodopirellula solitaria]TWT74229.1 hypothetical protein CA85_11160 [Allorhodopirellula solitaria]
MSWPKLKLIRSRTAVGPIAAIACSVMLLMTTGCRVESPPETAESTQSSSGSTETVASDSSPASTATVVVEIDKPGGDGEAEFRQSFDVAAGTTLEEVMRKIDEPEVVITGSGVTAFVQSMDGIETDASRGWTFKVDDEFSSVGIGSVNLTPPQTVRWQFTTLEEATQ